MAHTKGLALSFSRTHKAQKLCHATLHAAVAVPSNMTQVNRNGNQERREKRKTEDTRQKAKEQVTTKISKKK